MGRLAEISSIPKAIFDLINTNLVTTQPLNIKINLMIR
jgi:hypothetical protein